MEHLPELLLHIVGNEEPSLRDFPAVLGIRYQNKSSLMGALVLVDYIDVRWNTFEGSLLVMYQKLVKLGFENEIKLYTKPN